MKVKAPRPPSPKIAKVTVSKPTIRPTHPPSVSKPIPPIKKINDSKRFSVNSISRPMASRPKVPSITNKSTSNYRNMAVRNAWKAEKNLVKVGSGTREWTDRQRSELISKGKISNYQGHHIRSVNGHTKKWAQDPRNIAFLTRPEHRAAHGKDFRNPTTGKLIDRGKMEKMSQRNVLSKKVS